MPTIVDLERLGWGNPDEAGWFAANIVSFSAAGRTWRVNRAVKPLFHALILLMETNGVDIDAGPVLDDWSYANRDIRGYPGSKSWHSVGCAIDIDAIQNALGSSHTSFPIAKTRKAAEDCSLTWGYGWSRPDPMHFEFHDAKRDVAAALAKLKARHPLIYRKVMA